jgi:predicted enzyme related to lactoylglutathione lyase
LILLPTKLCQIEIPVSDIERSILFYNQVFGWKQVPAEMHEYIVLDVPDDCPYGISLIPTKKERTGDSVVLYFQTENPEMIAEAAKEHGGRLRFGPKRLGAYGNVYQIEDPDGNRFGLYLKPTT